MPPRTLGHYRLLDSLGEGGMGVVYRAVDIRLERTVALKILRPDGLDDPERRRRFAREAKAASALNHPNIVTIYDVDSDRGVDFIAMEHVEGESLQTRLAQGQFSLEDALQFAHGVAAALAAAHAVGIVHRDIKPANVMVTRRGQVKVLDFGLAKRTWMGGAGGEAPTRSVSLETEHGAVVGTLAYMSPEQAEGQPVDARSDVFSFGVLVYELVCGQRPFQGTSMAAVISAILRDAPPPARSLRADVPPELERILLRCLEKDRAKRYATGSEVLAELEACAARLFARRTGLVPTLSKPRAVTLGLVLLALGALVVPRMQRAARARWAEEKAKPEIARLTETGDYYGAFQLAREAERSLPGDPRLQRMLANVTLPIPIATRPAGARVLVKRYASPEAAWEPLGTTPIPDARVPYAVMRWKIIKPGFETIEAAPFGEQPFGELAGGLVLERAGTRPPGMVRVPGGPFRLRELPFVTLGDYWLDQYEVTNRQFKEFVDHGGYQKREYWPPIVEDGRPLAWNEAGDRFRDTTGRPGPAAWEVGSYPEGRAEFPVSGVSWYEASAYCTFADKTLPTVYHWYKAAAQRQVSDILGLSNLGTKEPARVGSHPGLGAYGTYDMAGNVKEWAWNETAGKRYALGGAWNEPAYMYQAPDARPAFERSPTIGLRCARAIQPVEAPLLAPTALTIVRERSQPASDAVFDAWRGIYAYSRSDLRATIDAVDDSSPHWRKETVSYNAAYGGERITAFVFVPRGTTPPYQAVLWVPGGESFLFPSSQNLTTPFLYDFLPRSGRVLVYPVYKGTYERRIPFSTASEWRDLMIQWSKDIGRTLDYLEARKDIDMGRLGYYALSSGARDGPIFMSIDGRFRAGVLLGGGLDGEPWELLPEVDVFNFAPRCRVPMLMINGRDDFLMPLDPTQRMLFRLLGAPEAHKRHALLAGGHLPSDLTGVIKETLAWLDRELGPVPGPPVAR